ncbi:hypothetical protein AB834_06730 [PVC group bacterium (ex Bugula neritina AB1)]|nr:hypothetical protein AB834_06730 [PVC group bacterium (ex Bugula neritina AB1)]
MKKLAILAGGGFLPERVAQEAQNQGYRVYVVGVRGQTLPSIEKYAYKIKWFELSELKKALLFLSLNRAWQVVLIGKIHKESVYKDSSATTFISENMGKDTSFKDENLLLKVIRYIEALGFKVLDSTLFLKGQLALEGCMSGQDISSAQKKDIAYGFSMAKKMAKLDIGQTVAVARQNIVAVEAMEGTDQTILRAGKYVSRGLTVVKVSRPSQDMRFDVPTVGFETLNSLKEANVETLAIEAGKTIIVDRTSFCEKAASYGITIYGYVEEGS